MSSAVPIHPLVRLARRQQPLIVTARAALATRQPSQRRPLSTSCLRRNAGGRGRSDGREQPLQASPSSPASSSGASAASALDGSAAARAYAASSRRKNNATAASAAKIEVKDQRAARTKALAERESLKNSNEQASSSVDPNAVSIEGSAQKMLGKDPSSSGQSSQQSSDKTVSQGAQDTSRANANETSPLNKAGEAQDQASNKADSHNENNNGIVVSPVSLARQDASRSFPFSAAFSNVNAARDEERSGDGQGQETQSPNAGDGSDAGAPSSPAQGSGRPGQQDRRGNVLLYPFNTHEFIKRLQSANIVARRTESKEPAELSEETSITANKRHDPAEAIMEAVQGLLITRGQNIVDENVNKVEVENQTYLFTAALAELRTELQVMARNDAAALRSMVTLLQREVDSLNQRMREDVDAMKHDIQVDMNNRKSEAKEEQNALEQEIQDLNNRFTISISDLKTEIEQSIKWDATRRALTIFFGCIVILIATLAAADYLTREDGEGEAANGGKAAQAAREQAENKPKSAEELGLVARDEEPSNRYV